MQSPEQKYKDGQERVAKKIAALIDRHIDEWRRKNAPKPTPQKVEIDVPPPKPANFWQRAINWIKNKIR